MNQNYRAVVVGILLNLCVFSVVANTTCQEVRAAFDIGSGSTKMKVARVDTCAKKIIEILQEKQLPIPYKDDLEIQRRQKNMAEFSDKIMERGIHAILQLKASAKYYHPVAYEGIATAAFREADNAQQFIKHMNETTQTHIHIISQEQEAKLGFWTTVQKLHANPEDILVWDIGGASMQLIALSPEKKDEYLLYQGKTASVPFKNILVDTFHPQASPKPLSPNPMSKTELQQAVQIAEELAQKNVPQEIKDLIAHKKVRVVGIGNVHLKNIQQNIDTETVLYRRSEVEKLLEDNVNLRDDEIDSKFASTFVSNMALVLGFMKALDIETVYTPSIDLTEGILIRTSLFGQS